MLMPSEFQNKDLLKGSGAISNAQMKAKVEREYEAFNLRRKELALMEEEQESWRNFGK